MAERIRMNFPMMEEMARTFGEGANVLEDAQAGVSQIVQLLEDETLLGRAGDSLVEACNGKLSPAIARLREKLVELAHDIKGARDSMLEADKSAESLY